MRETGRERETDKETRCTRTETERWTRTECGREEGQERKTERVRVTEKEKEGG